MKHTVYVALGSNIQSKVGHLKAAIQAIENTPSTQIKDQSPVYETVPKGYDDQDDFLNMVIKVETDLKSQDFLKALQQIEIDLKRVRTIKNGPRTIDLDILTFDEERIETEDLIIPHPRLHQRAFVLFPFADVGEKVKITGLDQSVLALRDALPQTEKDDVRVAGDLEEL